MVYLIPWIDRFHVTSLPPCWRTITKYLSLAFIVNSSNIYYKTSTCTKKHRLLRKKEIIDNYCVAGHFQVDIYLPGWCYQDLSFSVQTSRCVHKKLVIHLFTSCIWYFAAFCLFVCLFVCLGRVCISSSYVLKQLLSYSEGVGWVGACFKQSA